MSVHHDPLAWAREMDSLMGSGHINADNYLTDCANAVLYVRDTTMKNQHLERELAEKDKRIAEFEKMVCHPYCSMLARKDDRIAELEAENNRIKARCKEVVLAWDRNEYYDDMCELIDNLRELPKPPEMKL